MINESGVYFFSGGGHNHDGENSSLIDTNAYSLFDFNFGFQGGPSRLYRQSLNLDGFKQLVVNTVNESILEPAGIVLQPGIINGNAHIISRSITASEISANSITANEIAAGTITADLLSANIILVNQAISSNNYVTGVSGWIIDGDGSAEFDAAAIRGTITAGSVNIGAEDFWNSDGSFMLGGNTGIYTSNGVVRIGTSVIIEGSVVADSIYIDEDNYWDANSFSLNGSNGVSSTTIEGIGVVVRLGSDIYINPNDGSIFSSSGSFQVQSNGNLFSNSGDIGGWTIADDYLQSQEANPGTLTIGKFDANTSGLAVEDGNRIAMLELVGDGTVSDARLYVGHTNGSSYFESVYDVEGSMYTQTTGRITSTSAFFGPLFSTGDNADPYPLGGTYFTESEIYTAGSTYSDGEIESGGMITAGGTGVYYNASNLPGSRFGMAFGWDAGIASVSFIVNNDTNVDGYIVPDGFYSDRRLKENILSPTNELLEKIYNIKTYEFDYTNATPTEFLRGRHDVGVIADEFESLFPDMVINKDDIDKYKQVLYIKAIPLLLTAISDLNARLKALEE